VRPPISHNELPFVDARPSVLFLQHAQYCRSERGVKQILRRDDLARLASCRRGNYFVRDSGLHRDADVGFNVMNQALGNASSAPEFAHSAAHCDDVNLA